MTNSEDPARIAAAVAAASRRVGETMAGRRSTRAFRPDPVPRETVERILALAARAPSGSNIQPWKVHVLAGAARERVVAALTADHAAGAPRAAWGYTYYPVKWRAPYQDRRRALGWSLYGLLGIGKGDQERMQAQERRNFAFFDAPVGLIITIDRDMEQGSWVDVGIFVGQVLLAAEAMGLQTCPQAAFAMYDGILREEIGYPETEQVVCGIAIGHGDPDDVTARLETPREPVEGFATFQGFGE